MLRQKSVASTGTVGVAGSTVAMVTAYPAGIILLATVAALLAWQRNRRSQTEAAAAAVAVAAGADDGETCGWLNALATWFFLNKAASASADALPRLLEQRWLEALNAAIVEMAEAEDGGGCTKIAEKLRFEELLVGSLPPQVRSAAAGHCSDTHELQIRLSLRADEIRLMARLGGVGKDSSGASCEVVLLDVEAEAALRLRLCPRGFTGSIRLLSRPRLRAESKPLAGSSISAPDLASVSEVAVAALERAVTSLTLTEAAETAAIVVEQKQERQLTRRQQSEPQQQVSSSAAAVTRRQHHHHHHHHSKQAQRTSQPAMTVTPLASTTVATQQPGSNARLLVKVIKASSLLLPAQPDLVGAESAAPPASLRQLNAYACLELDEPYQRHVTGSVFGSANPYWDQHYMFDLNANSARLSMHVFDRSGRSDTLLGSASLRLSELPQLGARIMQTLRRPSRTAAVAGDLGRPATVGPTATLTAEFLFVCPATCADWPPMPTVSSSDTQSGQPNGDTSLSRALGAKDSVPLQPPSPENPSFAPVRSHSNREVDRNIDSSNGNDNKDCGSSDTTEAAPLYITVETLIVPENWASKLRQKQLLSACAAGQHESPDLGKPKGKPAGRSHSFASRIRRAFTGSGSGRRPVSSDRGELLVNSGLSGEPPPAVGSRGGGGGGLSGSLRRLLNGGRFRGQKQRLRPKDPGVQSSNPDAAGRNGWNSEEIL